jgi:hypothetical protein
MLSASERKDLTTVHTPVISRESWMMQKFMLGAYWDARADNLEKCTGDAALFLARLTKIDPLLANWYERGRSRKDALAKKVDILRAQELQGLLLAGRNRRDVSGEFIDELGFKLSLWNGADVEESEALVSIHCGANSERIGNSVIIDLPYQSETSEWVRKASILLALTAEVWQPNWAGIMSKKAMRERSFDGDNPFVDWMVYVPRKIASVPAPGRVEKLNGLGSVVVVQPHPPIGDDDEELARIQQVERLLPT